MPEHNTRAEEMWLQIVKSVWFSNMNVVDLGCGGGDFLWRTVQAGASSVLGVDKDISIAKQYAKIYRRTTGEGNGVLSVCDVVSQDLNAVSKVGLNFDADIAMCFSVIPYLEDPIGFLKWMSDEFPICLLEIQYEGDGPGLSNVCDAEDMRFLLKDVIGFIDVDLVGYTYVKENSFRRDIWRCML